jgi:flagellar protein FlaG
MNIEPTPRTDGAGVTPRTSPDRDSRPAKRVEGFRAASDRTEESGKVTGQEGREAKSLEGLGSVVNEANKYLESLQRDLRFQVHDATGQMMVEVVDLNTGEVLREQPPHEFLDLAARLREMVGYFLDATS